MANTLLSIDDIDFGDYSVRGLTMTLELIEQAKQIERTVNGEAVDLSNTAMRKYKSTISCTDLESPEFAGAVWPGKIVIVRFIPGLGTKFMDSDGIEEVISLQMMVINWSETRREAEARTDWQLDLEEV